MKLTYWQLNLLILFILLSIWFLVSFGFGIIWSEDLDQIKFGGFKLGFWFAQQGSIYFFVIIIFIYIYLMNKLDKKFYSDYQEKNKDNPVFYVQYAHARCKSLIRIYEEKFELKLEKNIKYSEKLELDEELDLIKQIENRVRWRESVINMIENDVDHFIEIGPGKVLSGLVKRINRNVKIDTINGQSDIESVKI